MFHNMLTERKKALLKTLIGEYIESASPVASESVTKKHSLGVSSATVRNYMADLEDHGYITRPHHSSGAVPSDKGYRFYVESLADIGSLPEDFQYSARDQLKKAEQDIEVWTHLAATVLAQFVNNAAVVTYPRQPVSKVLRINLVHVQESLAFLVVVLGAVKLRKQLLPLTKPLSSDDMQKFSNKLTDSMVGLNRWEIMERSITASELERTVTDRVLDIMETEDQESYRNHYVEGLRHLVNQPEFSQGDKAREIVAIFEDKDLPRVISSEAPATGRLKVIIGTENHSESLRPLSMVLCQYGLPGGGLGSVGALGPTRMEYSRTIAGVRFISSLLTEVMAQTYV